MSRVDNFLTGFAMVLGSRLLVTLNLEVAFETCLGLINFIRKWHCLNMPFYYIKLNIQEQPII